MIADAQAIAAFQDRFAESPKWLVRAPGRVNIIGEHTDYNDGFVLPMAIDLTLWIALRPRNDARVVAESLNDADARDYVRGVGRALREEVGDLRGWEGIIASDIPIGAGLASSAALAMAVMRGLLAVNDLPWFPESAARLGRRVENEYIGVDSGIMDQLAVTNGRAGHALLIDCRTLAIEYVPMTDSAAIVLLDTGTRRGLVASAYNERRRQCQQAARAFDVAALRDVDFETFMSKAASLDPVIRRRAQHVITENQRTLQAAEAMRANDVVALGRLMSASHASLRDDFEVSTEALDALVATAGAQPGCFGARMTGGGFGGCAIALVDADRVTEFEHSLSAEARLHRCRPAGGVEALPTP